jgi:hypothetical protein
MAKHRSHKRRSHSKSRTMRLKGGALAGNPASSWGWGLGTLGNGWTQFTNALTLQPGQNLASSQSNNIVPVGGLNAQNSQHGIGPDMKGAIPSSVGGRRRRRRSKRGGNIFAQAAVPVALIAMNNALGSRRRTRKHKY